MELEATLARLLGEMFAPDELRRFLRHQVDPKLTADLPDLGSVAAADYVGRAAEKLIGRGLVTREFCQAWAQARPKRAAEILALLDGAAPAAGNVRPGGRSDGARAKAAPKVASASAGVAEVGAVLARLDAAEVPWTETIADVSGRVGRGEAVVVLAPRKGGSSSFARQLAAHLRREHPTWTVTELSARPFADEDVAAYLRRMRGLMGVEPDGRHSDGSARETGGRLVACIHGWSRRSADRDGERRGKLAEHLEALGHELRARMEGGTRARPFSMVAVGGYPLFLLRYQRGALSALNSASEVALPGLSKGQVHALMEDVQPGAWTEQDAEEVTERGGGHPHLTKALLRAWCVGPRAWGAAEERLEDDNDYLVPTLTAAARDRVVVDALRRCLEREDGIRLKRLNPDAPGHFLLWSGLLIRDGKQLGVRCDVVRRMVAELLEDDEA